MTTRTLAAALRRSQKFLRKLKRQPGWNFSKLTDARQPGKCRHTLEGMAWTVIEGLLTRQSSLRGVEFVRAHTRERISDSTLAHEIARMDPGELQRCLDQQVRGMHRRKQLRPVGLPCGIATIDGKNLATLSHDANGTGHLRSASSVKKWAKQARRRKGKSYYLMPALRTTLTSARTCPALAQFPIPKGTSEEGAAPDALAALHRAYGKSDLFSVIDADAGLTSFLFAEQILALGYHYILGLKDNQPTLSLHAKRILEAKATRESPEAITDWERHQGRRIRRELYRTDSLNQVSTPSHGYWSSIQQTWLVRQTIIDPKTHACVTTDRYFITSLPWHTFTPQQCLRAVRYHWVVENKTFHALDVQFREDQGPWCTQGNAVWVLGLFRLMVLNAIQMLRNHILCRKHPSGARPPPLPFAYIFFVMQRLIIRIPVPPD